MKICKQHKEKEQVQALPFIVPISPLGYPSARLHPCIARFRFARQDHYSSAVWCSLKFRIRGDTREIAPPAPRFECNRLVTTADYSQKILKKLFQRDS